MSVVAWAAAGTPLAGQLTSGDRAVVVPFAGGALVAVIDGLGHGREACLAAKQAEQVLVDAPHESVSELVTRCHERLRTTRGVVISLASFDGHKSSMTWLGIGNVEGLLVRAQYGTATEAVAMRGGTVGYMLPPLNPRTLLVHPGDTLVLATDGIKHGFKEEVVLSRTPQEIADGVLARWAKPSDDACVVVARYVGLSDTTNINIDEEQDVAHARIRSRDLARGIGFTQPKLDAFATAVSELARNILDHAQHGEILITCAPHGIVVVARDRGPGIADVDRALQDDYTSKSSMGCGLSGARRLVDKLEIASELGVGTVVRIEKWL